MVTTTSTDHPLARTTRRHLLAAASAALLLAACGERAGSGKATNTPKFKSVDITGANFARSLNLIDAATGERRTLESYRGKVTLFFFGYMFCPDYCPTTMTMLNQAFAKMRPEDVAKVQVVFVTVDPKRDKPEELVKYVRAFHPSFSALWGSEEEIAATAKEWKIVYQKAQVKDEFTYLVDHSTQMYVFDAQGRLRLMIKHEAGPEVIAEDLTTLVRTTAG
ncbi:MAG: SCO family protein [Casimicrobiaceae bacterium]|nr:SCO family protein [Casimicrobiaceae bacterium]